MLAESDKELIERCRDLLRAKMTEGRLITIVDATEPVLSLRCKLQRQLAEARNTMRMPKDKEYTDFDRTVMLEGSVAEIRENFELVKGLEELLKQRIEVTQWLFNRQSN